VPFRRRGEPLHERLAREGGLVDHEAKAPWREVGIHGIQRPPEADATVTVEAPEVEADTVRFVALADGSLLVEEGPESSLETLATAVEQEVRPPYRARGVRHHESLWALQASRIEILELPDAPGGQVIDVSRTDEGTTVSVDEQRIFGSIPALEERGEREGRHYAVHAERLDGDLWEIRAAAL
jgi:hypothetical protein